jgi:hypothetical protein
MQELPWSGQISLADLLDFIARAPAALDCVPVIDHRVVAYQDDHARWVVYASGLYVGVPNETRTVERLGPLTLVSHRATPGAIDSPDKFRDFVHQWPHLTAGGELLRQGFNESLLVERYSSDYGPLAYPCWRTSLYYATLAPDPLPSRGPFYDESTDRFAETVADASVQWLNDEVYRQGSSPSSSLRIVIVDPRARLTAIRRSGDTVNIVVDGTRPEMRLNLVVKAVGYGETKESATSVTVLPAEGGGRIGTISFDRPLQRFRALLFGPDGQVYDEVNESVSRPSARGYELFGIDPRQQDRGLTYVLANGESETSECKEWMPTDVSEAKSFELLKAVCAFANGSGGSIYVGVTDDLEVKGTDRRLREWAARQKRSRNIEDLRFDYTKALRARIAEGIAPSVPVDVDWILHAGGEHVCRIKVVGSGRIIHSVIATNDIFVRRGASNRKARPEELLAPKSNAGLQ